jgi:hypothetical protein
VVSTTSVSPSQRPCDTLLQRAHGQCLSALAPQRLDQGARELQVGEKRSAGLHGLATDQVAVRAAVLVVLARHVDDQVDLAGVDQFHRTLAVAGQLGDRRAGNAERLQRLGGAPGCVDRQLELFVYQPRLVGNPVLVLDRP